MTHQGSCHCGLRTPEAALSEYTFNRHHIKHQFCAVCGCAPFAFGKDPKGADTVAINVRCLPDLAPRIRRGRAGQRFIASKNSPFDLVSFILSSRNSIDASSSIGCRSLRRIHILASSP